LFPADGPFYRGAKNGSKVLPMHCRWLEPVAMLPWEVDQKTRTSFRCNLIEGAIMSSISAVGLVQDVLSAINSPRHQALQALENCLPTGDLGGAQSAFQSLQDVLQAPQRRSTTQSSISQITSDPNSLGSTLSSGNLSSARSAFATFLGALQSTPSPAQSNEANAASQSVPLVEELLITMNSARASSAGASSTTSADATISLLQSF
jgi:hypothetical protein